MRIWKMTKEKRQEVIVSAMILVPLTLFTVFLSVFISANLINASLAKEVNRSEHTIIVEKVCSNPFYNASTKSTQCEEYRSVERLVVFITKKGPFWAYTSKEYVK